MLTPASEWLIDAALVSRLLADQHPDLPGEPTLVAHGWDNDLYRLPVGVGVRLPRRAAAAQLTLNEQRWLPSLAARLPVPVPTPVRHGSPTPYYPWPWSVTPWFEGQPVDAATPVSRIAFAAQLAEFLAALHMPAPHDAPVNTVRGVPLQARDGSVRQRLESGALAHARELRGIWEHALAAPQWSGSPLWLHGDVHPANLVSQADGVRLGAVLDFGDLTSGDPATDLAAAWLVFEPAGRDIFRQRYAALRVTDAALWQRARGWALVMGTALVVHSDDSPRLSEIGEHALGQVLLEA